MKVNLKIDRVVLDGAALTRRERAHLAETIERELIRLLRDHPDRGAVAPSGSGPPSLGTRIAGALLAALPPGVLGPPGRPPGPVPPGPVPRGPRPAGRLR